METGEFLLLVGPNRRSERTIIEQHLLPDARELAVVAGERAGLLVRLRPLVAKFDGRAVGKLEAITASDTPPLEVVAGLFNHLGLALQQWGGHRVETSGFEPDRSGRGVWAWFEYEHHGVGGEAADLALQIIAHALAVGKADNGPAEPSQIQAAMEDFRARAAGFVLPLDTEAIIRAAERLDLPCFKLDRDPYPGLNGAFRIRPNGLLMIGHARHRQIVDGTFCVTRCARLQPLVHNREAVRKLLESLQVPLARRVPGAGNCALVRRAQHAAEAIGWPVVVKPGTRAAGPVRLNLRSPEALRVAIEAARTASQFIAVEQMVDGDPYRILVAGGEPLVLLQDRQELELRRANPDLLDLVRRITAHLDVGMAAYHLVTTDIGRPLEETGGAVVDLEIAPALDRLLEPDSRWYDVLAERFLGWLSPPASPARIPIVAVTGTNGKTTTCRMTARILRESGLRTGLACSEGVYVDERFEATRADIGPGAHHHLLDREDVEAAVFEEFFGRIARFGFAYRRCDVAVCTNVTPDHLGRIGTHTLEQMAGLKRAVPDRARTAVVLNADDRWCRAMAERCGAKRVCLVSKRESLETEMRVFGARGARCVIERVDERDWIILYDAERRIPLIAVTDIPATFEGAAGFNVSNAMHAAAAGYFAGATADQVAAALRSFEMSFEATPGRINRFEGLPYLAIMDNAHNADGFRQLSAYLDRLAISGRRIVMVGLHGDRREEDILAAIAELAGHFDRYVCRNFRVVRERAPHEVPEMLRRGLLAAGVAPDAVDVVPDADQAVRHALDMAGPGDLVVLLLGTVEYADVWELLKARRSALFQAGSSTALSAATK